MKKKLYTFVCLLLAIALPLASFAEEETDRVLEGMVTEIVEGGFLMEDAEMGTVMLNTDDATVWDGLVAQEALQAGHYVIVEYDGRMTRSLPPQAHADRVGCYMVQGFVRDIFEDGSFLLEGDPIHGEVIVHTEGVNSPVFSGVIATVYYDGVMALSLPGQVSARHIDVPHQTGTVSEWTEESFLLTAENGMVYQVNMNENTHVGVMEEAVIQESSVLEEDESDFEMNLSEDAEALLSETADAFFAMGEAQDKKVEMMIPGEGTPDAFTERVEVLETLEWGNGDTVTVYYNGILSKSIPPQMAALEVLVHK